MARHDDDMTTKWQQHGDEMTAMWRPCGGDVAAIWQQCGGDVAAMRHRRHVVAMSLSRRRHVVVVSSRCRCYVVVMSSWCRRPVVVMLSPFHRHVVTMSTPPLPIRPAMDPPVPTGRLCRQAYKIYLIYIKSYWLNHSNDQILIWIIYLLLNPISHIISYINTINWYIPIIYDLFPLYMICSHMIPINLIGLTSNIPLFHILTRFNQLISHYLIY